MSKGLSSVKTLSAREIAKKWKLPLSVVIKKIADGVKIEKEHTKSTRQANEIARDHLGERPDYYDKLDKMEKQKIVVRENTNVTGVGGLGFNTGTPAVEGDNEYTSTNALARDSLNGAKLEFMKKIHNNIHKKQGFKEFDPTNIKSNSNKDLVESLGSDYGTSSSPIVGDLTGSSRKVMKVDEIKLPKVPEKVKTKTRKAIAVGMTTANLATGADIYDRASRGVGSPVRDVAAAASGLPGKLGYAAMGTNYTIKGFDKAREHLRAKIGKKMEEATFQGKKVPLNKPMKGDVKKSKVFVDPDGDGKAQKVNFGDPNMTIKKSNPARRKSFRARHNCDNPGPKTKARYWSCKAWEETEINEISDETVKSHTKKVLEKLPKQIAKKNYGLGKERERAKDWLEKRNKGSVLKMKRELRSIKEEQIDEISAELVGKVSNARFFRGEAPSKVLTRAINKKFIESGKKDKGRVNKDKKEVKEYIEPYFVTAHKEGEGGIRKRLGGRMSQTIRANKPDAGLHPGAKGMMDKTVAEVAMAMPPQVQPPAIHGSQRAGVQRQVSRPTSVSGSASGRIAGQTGSMSAKPNVKVSSGVQPSIERSWKTSGRGTMGTSGGSMSATPKVSTAYSQGGVNVGKAMGASKQTSPVVKGMTSAGREAAAAVSKAAPMASRVAGAALRVAGGPAATAAAAVMSPTAANAGEDEKKRQETLKSYNPYKSSGRSVSDYEKQALSPQKYEAPKSAAPKVDAPMAPKRPDYFTRGQAFQAARGEAGGSGGKFSYGGKEFQTNVAGEKYSSKPKQTSVTDIKETTMDTKDLINEALDSILENNLVEMKENFMTALNEKAMEKLEERKKAIAADYFAQ